MKTLVALILATLLFSNASSASIVICDWKQIQSNPNGTFTYSKDLHVCVGHLVFNQIADNQQISDLNKALDDLGVALQKSDEQAQIWKSTSNEENLKINEIKSQERSKGWILFGLGFLAASVAIYGTAAIYRR
jgi:hypothetical protein